MTAGTKKENLKRAAVCPGTRCFVVCALIIPAGALIIFGCAQNFGRYQLSDEVRDAFESYRALPDYIYYYTGREHRPDAVLGVHRDYKLESDFWSEVDPTHAQLKAWIGQLTHAGPSRQTVYGYYILDTAGRRVGIWYSRFSGVPVKVEADNRIVAYALLEQPAASGGDGE